MKFLTINGKLQRDSSGRLITIPDNYDNSAITLNGKLLKTGGGLIGSNIIKRQLSAPSISLVSGTTIQINSIDNNATTIAVYADNTKIGEVAKEAPAPATKYSVTISNGSGSGVIYAVYDGSDSSGILLGDSAGTYEISSGHIYYEYSGSIFDISVSGGVTSDGTVTGNGTITINFTCLTGDMLITLPDRSQKRIDEITLDDKVLSYNPNTMLLEPDTITYCDSDKVKTDNKYDIWTFSDGTIVKTVHRHRFYNVERQAMTYMDEWKIGEHTVSIDGAEVELVSHEVVEQEVRHFTIFTENQNYFVNGLLSGNRHTKKMNLPIIKEGN